MIYQIGAWRFDPRANELTQDGATQRLERRAAETLTLLAERSGEVVSKDEILAAIWNGNAVSEHSIAIVISALRKALHDDARAPTYIETVPKRGYRLVADVDAAPEREPRPAPLDQSPAGAPPAPAAVAPRVRLPAIVGAASALLVAGAFSVGLIMDAAVALGPDDGMCPLELKRSINADAASAPASPGSQTADN